MALKLVLKCPSFLSSLSGSSSTSYDSTGSDVDPETEPKGGITRAKKIVKIRPASPSRHRSQQPQKYQRQSRTRLFPPVHLSMQVQHPRPTHASTGISNLRLLHRTRATKDISQAASYLLPDRIKSGNVVLNFSIRKSLAIQGPISSAFKRVGRKRR